jgi:hypothetical protein
VHQSDQVAAVDVTDPAGGWQQRAERAEAELAELRERVAVAVDAFRAMFGDVS